MSEYIDKTEMLIRLKCLEPKKDDFNDDDCFQAAESQHDMICEYLKPMQPANVAPVVNAHWIISSDGYYPYCSRCLCEPESKKLSKYCSECGSHMIERTD